MRDRSTRLDGATWCAQRPLREKEIMSILAKEVSPNTYVKSGPVHPTFQARLFASHTARLPRRVQTAVDARAAGLTRLEG